MRYKMKRKLILLAVIVCSMTGMQALPCTNFLAGKKASVDGSVMISYSALLQLVACAQMLPRMEWRLKVK